MTDEETLPPVYENSAQRPPHGWIRPTEERIENGVDGIIEMVRAYRSMNDLMAPEAATWQPSKFTRHQWRFFVENVLRADAAWRWEHPEEPV